MDLFQWSYLFYRKNAICKVWEGRGMEGEKEVPLVV